MRDVQAQDEGGGVRITITVPMPPNLTNRRSGGNNWRSVASEKKRYMKMLDERQGYGLIPAPPAQALTRTVLRSTMYLGHAMDEDNAVARHKWAIDWLRTRGYVRKDSPDSLTWAAFPEQVVRRGQEYRIEITLREAA